MLRWKEKSGHFIHHSFITLHDDVIKWKQFPRYCMAICAGNSPVPGEFPAQRPVTWSFDVFFDLRLNNWLGKQSWGRWFDTPSCPLWRHSNDMGHVHYMGSITSSIPVWSCKKFGILSFLNHANIPSSQSRWMVGSKLSLRKGSPVILISRHVRITFPPENICE